MDMDTNISYALAYAELTMNDYILIAEGEENSFYGCLIEDNNVVTSSNIFSEPHEWLSNLKDRYPGERFRILSISRFDIKHHEDLTDIKEMIKLEHPDEMLEVHSVLLSELTYKIVPSPFDVAVWKTNDGDCVLNKDKLKQMIENENFATHKKNHEWLRLNMDDASDYHHARVANLIVNPNNSPILLNLYKDKLQVSDGFHRLSAHIYQEQKTIDIAFPNHLLSGIKKMYPNLLKEKKYLSPSL